MGRAVEGLEVELQAVDGGGAVHLVPMTLAAGTVYSGETELECPDGRSLTLSALFHDSLGNTVTQPLMELRGVGSEGGWSVETLWDTLQSSLSS